MWPQFLGSLGDIQRRLPLHPPMELLPETFLFFPPQGPPGLKGEQGDTVVIDYDGRILDALKVAFLVDQMRLAVHSLPLCINPHCVHRGPNLTRCCADTERAAVMWLMWPRAPLGSKQQGAGAEHFLCPAPARPPGAFPGNSG